VLQNLTVNELVNVLYLDTPEEKKWMAKENLNKILRKLEKVGKIKAIVTPPPPPPPHIPLSPEL
jgi:hypothetical protein